MSKRRDTLDNIINGIDDIYLKFVQVRSIYRYIHPKNVGESELKSPVFYSRRGFDNVLRFDKPINEDFRKRYNAIGHWINQSYLIRLQAFLEYHHFTGSWNIVSGTPGAEEMDILRRLRIIFVHTKGNYNSKDPDQRKLRETIITHFNLTKEEEGFHRTNFPIPLDKVVSKLTSAIKEYVKYNYDKEPIQRKERKLS